MTDTTNDEQSRYAWARRPSATDKTEPDVPEGYGVPEGTLEPDTRPTEVSEQTRVTPVEGPAQPAPPAHPAQLEQPEQPSPYAPPPRSWASPQGGAYPPPPAPQGPPQQGPPQYVPQFGQTAPIASTGGTAVDDPARPDQRPAPGDAPQGAAFGLPGPQPAPGDSPTGPAGPGGPYPPVPRQRDRRPGWGGVIGVGVGAAILSALLTAGLIQATDDGTTTGTTNSSSAARVQGPVTTSTVDNPDWAKVAAAVEPSVVAVQVTTTSGEGEGSGVILNKDGEIVTNNHVVAGADEGGTVKVVLNDGRGYSATVVGTDPQTDLAVIKLQNPPADLTPATIGSSADVGVGDPVMAVGNPLGLAGTVTTGIISATDRPTTTASSESNDQFGGTSDAVYTNAIQTDAAVNPGNSGGALVDVQGRVIGIPSSIASLGSSSSSSQSGSIGLGFAIPIDEAKVVADQLADGKTVQHSWLGVSLTEGTAKVDDAEREAPRVTSVESSSPAAKAGLERGDAVIAVDGEAVNSYTSLVGQLRERQPGTSVKLTVVRDGKTQDVTVTLGTKPSTES